MPRRTDTEHDLTAVVWEDPAPSWRRSNNTPLMDLLREHENEWARLPVPTTLQSSLTRVWGKRGYEFTHRTIDKKGCLYGRYVGPDGDGA